MTKTSKLELRLCLANSNTDEVEHLVRSLEEELHGKADHEDKILGKPITDCAITEHPNGIAVFSGRVSVGYDVLYQVDQIEYEWNAITIHLSNDHAQSEIQCPAFTKYASEVAIALEEIGLFGSIKVTCLVDGALVRDETYSIGRGFSQRDKSEIEGSGPNEVPSILPLQPIVDAAVREGRKPHEVVECNLSDGLYTLSGVGKKLAQTRFRAVRPLNGDILAWSGQRQGNLLDGSLNFPVEVKVEYDDIYEGTGFENDLVSFMARSEHDLPYRSRHCEWESLRYDYYYGNLLEAESHFLVYEVLLVSGGSSQEPPYYIGKCPENFVARGKLSELTDTFSKLKDLDTSYMTGQWFPSSRNSMFIVGVQYEDVVDAFSIDRESGEDLYEKAIEVLTGYLNSLRKIAEGDVWVATLVGKFDDVDSVGGIIGRDEVKEQVAEWEKQYGITLPVKYKT